MRKFLIEKDKNIKSAFKALNLSGYKCLVVVNNIEEKLFYGTLSDGDLRRSLLKKSSLKTKVGKIANRRAKYILQSHFTFGKARKLLKKFKINLIPIVNKNKKILNIHKIDQNLRINKSKSKTKLIKNIALVIMAGGLGTRLDPFTKILPKALMPVNNKTIIENIIENLRIYGIKNIYASINFKAELIKAYFSKIKKNFKIRFIEENFFTGTIGSLKFLMKEKFKNFIVSNCDIILKIDYSDLARFHLTNNHDFTIVAVKKSLKLPYGVCKIDKKNNLTSFDEKPGFSFLSNAGVYMIKKNIISLIPSKKKYDVNEFINLLIEKDKSIGVYKINEKSWVDVGQMVDYKKNIKKIYE
jgi:dTDP-glucose pyrophosphorylase